MSCASPSPTPLFDLMRDKMRLRNMSLRTEKTYIAWVRQFLRFHGGQDPRELGVIEVEAFLTHLATRRHVSPSTQNQALQAIIFLYRRVLELQPPWVSNVVRSQKGRRLPVVLTRDEVRRVLAELPPRFAIIGHLLYGTGMRLGEALQLRVKDIEFTRAEIIVRSGKGDKDRITVLPQSLVPVLREHYGRLHRWFSQQRRAEAPGVSLPYALRRKYPQAPLSWEWQYIFPSKSLCRDPYTGAPVRHHIHHKNMQRAMQELLGHSDVATTMIYTHVLNRGGRGVISPADVAMPGLPTLPPRGGHSC